MDTAIPMREHASPHDFRVLIVEDNVDTAESLAILLRISGYDVRTAYSGQTALEIAGSFGPNVVLSDIRLPCMDGYVLCQRLRSRFSGLRVIAMTGYAQPTDCQRSKEAGFELHLVKPVEPSHILKMLAEMKIAEQERALLLST